MHRLRREAHDVMGYGLALEGLGVVAETQEAFAPDPGHRPAGLGGHEAGLTQNISRN